MKRNLTLLIFLFVLLQHLSAQPTCVTEACCCGNAQEVGIPNGNFEDPPIAPLAGRITFFAGETYSTWSVLGGSIDLLGPNYSNFTAGNPNGPSQFIDLNGFTPGTIATCSTGSSDRCCQVGLPASASAASASTARPSGNTTVHRVESRSVLRSGSQSMAMAWTS